MAYAPSGQAKYGDGEEYELRAPGEYVYNVHEPREKAIIEWRLDCFCKLGFTALLAATLASRRDVDREQVTALIRAGATPVQVADIVL